MYCQYCGKEVEENWIKCPYCGKSLNDDLNEKEAIENSDVKFTSREDLKKYLTEHAWSTEKKGVVAWYGSASVSKDLFTVLENTEIPEYFYHAYKKSILGFLKNTRFFRNYIVCTGKRLVFYERGSQILKLIPFLKSVISIPYQDITGIEIKKRFGIYSGLIVIGTKNKQYQFVMLSYKDAESLKELLTRR